MGPDGKTETAECRQRVVHAPASSAGRHPCRTIDNWQRQARFCPRATFRARNGARRAGRGCLLSISKLRPLLGIREIRTTGGGRRLTARNRVVRNGYSVAGAL
eukprot:scaffold5310_cov114-Isochrysis_galbana.AAC.4